MTYGRIGDAVDAMIKIALVAIPIAAIAIAYASYRLVSWIVDHVSIQF